ncbi:WXG100 family type VII secretion target [Amycolatopsis anabasis]|uniref:WXG100 family type VII secretion target n=1 Tax=Amycolatopsis anabasis TaxID=1840409 RepID=UPI001FE671B3|nr:WXG100 family type VII secretion target [Amycolatopsis anabasis]
MGQMDGTQIYHNFTNANSELWRSVAAAVKELNDGYRDEALAINNLQGQMQDAWTGASGDAAYAGAGPLAQTFKESATPLDNTTRSMNDQSSAFDSAKTSVVEVPPAPEKPSGWSLGLKAAIPVAGPIMAANDVNSYQEGVSKHNAANENNVRVMDQYSSTTNSTRGQIPMDYRELPLDGASVGVRTGSSASIESREIVGPQHTQTSGTSGTQYAPTTGPGSPVSGGPSVNPGQSTTSGPGPVPGQGGGGPVHTPNVPPPSTSGPNTHTTGAPPIIPGPLGGNRDRGTERTPFRGGRPGEGPTTGYGRGSASNRLYGEGGGRSAVGTGSGAKGPAGEGAAGRGPAGERGLGAGKGSGVGMPGSAAAAEGAAARSAAARGGVGAAGPLGAAGRGQGEEDQEHQRPDFLIEADPDSIFGTDERATPPVIGE